jgi:hypothetical protein
MKTEDSYKSLFKSLDATIDKIYLDRKELDFTANGVVYSSNFNGRKYEKISKDVEFKGSCKKVNYQDLMLMVEKEQGEFNSDFVL